MRVRDGIRRGFSATCDVLARRGYVEALDKARCRKNV